MSQLEKVRKKNYEEDGEVFDIGECRGCDQKFKRRPEEFRTSEWVAIDDETTNIREHLSHEHNVIIKK